MSLKEYTEGKHHIECTQFLHQLLAGLLESGIFHLADRLSGKGGRNVYMACDDASDVGGGRFITAPPHFMMGFDTIHSIGIEENPDVNMGRKGVCKRSYAVERSEVFDELARSGKVEITCQWRDDNGLSSLVAYVKVCLPHVIATSTPDA